MGANREGGTPVATDIRSTAIANVVEAVLPILARHYSREMEDVLAKAKLKLEALGPQPMHASHDLRHSIARAEIKILEESLSLQT